MYRHMWYILQTNRSLTRSVAIPIHRLVRLDSATLSQLAFLREIDLNFPQEKRKEF